ncbi:hypothetical protein BB558_004507 [Smittium angustum]|uniref:Uncharacterized protein n=1 Tax=Smittium angustum TaxID=133377 RepID=A0A2U1J356_SMIAN|nr:hypothetical protein BB558_004507 [Smittium angustum]
MSIPFSPPINLKALPQGARAIRFQYDFSLSETFNQPQPNVYQPQTKPMKRTLAYIIPYNHQQNCSKDSQNQSNIKNPINQPTQKLDGHILGVNAIDISDFHPEIGLGLIDPNETSSLPKQIMYTGGRDGSVKAWALDPLKNGDGLRKTTCLATSTHHIDWINSIVSVNNGKTVISGSSDLSIQAWTPFSEEGSKTGTIGTHKDYIKTLALCPGYNKIISGGLDSVINIWDIQEGSFKPTLITDNTSIKTHTSVYSLHSNWSGSVVATGSTDKAVGLWDIRMRKLTGSLMGHTDHVTSVVVSEGGDYVLSGSSDTTVKLWSLKTRRCISTFSNHDASVWSLYSTDPSFETFYSADRNGYVMKTQSHQKNSSDTTVIIAKEDNAILQVFPEPNGSHIWTASYGSKLNCWNDITEYHFEKKARLLESACEDFGLKQNLSLEPSNQKIGLENNTKNSFNLATSEGPHQTNQSESSKIQGSDSIEAKSNDTFSEPVYSSPVESISGPPGLRKHFILQNKRHVLAMNTDGEISLWDIVLAKCIRIFGNEWGSDLESIADSLNHPIQTVPSWCTVDTKIGLLTVQIKQTQAWDAEVYVDQLNHLSRKDCIKLLEIGCERIHIGPWMIRILLENYKREWPGEDKVTEETANSICEWVTRVPVGDESKLENILQNYKMENDKSLKNIGYFTAQQAATSNGQDPNLKPPPNPPNTTTKDGQNESKSGTKSTSKFLSWKFGKSKKDKKAQSTSPHLTASPSTASSNENLTYTKKAHSEALSQTNSNTLGKGDTQQQETPKTFYHCTEIEKNLILLLEPKSKRDTGPCRNHKYYPICKLPSGLKIIVLEEDSDSVVPTCIYFSSITSKDTSFSQHSRHSITDNHLLTLEISLPSWVVEYYNLNRFPLTHSPPSQLVFSLRPYPTSFMQLYSLDSNNTFLTAHPMLRISKMSAYVSENLHLHLPPSNYVEALAYSLKEYSKKESVSSVLEIKDTDTSKTHNAEIKNETEYGVKCHWEILLEKYEGDISIDERMVLRAILKLPSDRIPRKLLQTLPSYQETSEIKNDQTGNDGVNGTEPIADINSQKEVIRSHGLPESGDSTDIQRMNIFPFLWLDFYCKNQLLDPMTTLGTIRTFIWKSSQEINISYKWKQFVIDRVYSLSTKQMPE